MRFGQYLTKPFLHMYAHAKSFLTLVKITRGILENTSNEVYNCKLDNNLL